MRNASAGFTLIELMVTGAVVFVLLGGITMVLAEQGRQAWERTNVQVVTLTGAQRALDRLSEDLRQARQANLTCGAETLAFDPVSGGARVTYTRNGAASTLVRTEQGQAGQVVAGGLTGFTPTCLADGLTRLALTAQETAPSGISSTRTLSSQVWVQSP